MYLSHSICLVIPRFLSSFSIVGKMASSVLYLSLGSGIMFSPNSSSSSLSLTLNILRCQPKSLVYFKVFL